MQPSFLSCRQSLLLAAQLTPSFQLLLHPLQRGQPRALPWHGVRAEGLRVPAGGPLTARGQPCLYDSAARGDRNCQAGVGQTANIGKEPSNVPELSRGQGRAAGPSLWRGPGRAGPMSPGEVRGREEQWRPRKLQDRPLLGSATLSPLVLLAAPCWHTQCVQHWLTSACLETGQAEAAPQKPAGETGAGAPTAALAADAHPSR
ncbi:hypothetical protein KIL84_021725 [Mauremys mutica]|uniref:Uncharacterized protein n=1 Tax=Mauremys mutica TaxID=74926 RepID=A0A9D4AWM4_9SAUR|nr:hypothetical protein KIL84_021725 [Mauremys mutica]